MKKIAMLLSVVSLVLLSDCNKEAETEHPTCTDGILNQDETGIDCGGKCIECFDCFTEYCTYLSGGIFSDYIISIEWKCTHLDGEEFIPDPNELTDVLLSMIIFKFNNKGDANFISGSGSRDGRWMFDNPQDPKIFYIKFPDNENNVSFDIVSLKEDELKVIWYAGEIATFEPIS
jgi:hypothetical protein